MNSILSPVNLPSLSMPQRALILSHTRDTTPFPVPTANPKFKHSNLAALPRASVRPEATWLGTSAARMSVMPWAKLAP